MTLRERIRALVEEEKPYAQIAEELGVHINTVYKHSPKSRMLASDLNREVWLAFLKPKTVRVPTGSNRHHIVVNGTILDDRHLRRFFAWEIEESGPGFRTVDSFCTFIGLHIQDFLDWCEHEGLNPWAKREPPGWEV